MTISFTTALLSAVAIATPDLGPRFDFAPHVLQNNPDDGSGMTHEICSRAVDRALDKNIDFNTILEENSGTWEDETFSGWDRIFWRDYRTTDTTADESDREWDTEWARVKDVFKDPKYSMWGSTDISFEDPM